MGKILYKIMTDWEFQFINCKKWTRYADKCGFSAPGGSPHYYESDVEIERVVKLKIQF